MGLPLAVKLSPYFSSVGNLALRLVDAGADGLVLFNRFYQPDLDVETLAVEPRLHLSTSDDLLLPLRWLGILHGRIDASMAASGGVHRGTDVAKALLVGADVAMMTAALLQHGPRHVQEVEAELRYWMQDHEYESVEQLRGSVSQSAFPGGGSVRAGQLRQRARVVLCHAADPAVRAVSSSARPVDTTTAALAGLSSSEAAARLERDGPNELPCARAIAVATSRGATRPLLRPVVVGRRCWP